MNTPTPFPAMVFSRSSGLEQLLQRPEQQSPWRRFLRSPIRYLASALYQFCQVRFHATDDSSRIRVVCISDTHNTQPSLPDGDILLHAGDLTQSGSVEELNAQIEWLDAQPHQYKVVIAGNHEICLDRNKTADEEPASINFRSLIYLNHSSTTLHFGSQDLRVFGSPYTPRHGNWAFQYPRPGPDPWEGNIPEQTDILLTHGPPKTHLDLGHLGCQYLLSALWSMKRKPIFLVCGHIHGGYGEEVLCWDAFQAAYESAMTGNKGWLGLVKLAYYAFQRAFARSFGTWDRKEQTHLVNAAAIGGVRDEKRRDPIVVTI